MTEINSKLLELINQGRTLNEICNLMNLSYKQLYNRLLTLKKYGINLERKFYYDGESTYQVSKQLNEKNSDEKTIITTKQDMNFKALLISDLHLGNIYDRLDSLYKLYEYAIKEGIHIILNTGDLIDGLVGKSKNQKSIFEQVEYAIKNHPYDKKNFKFYLFRES